MIRGSRTTRALAAMLGLLAATIAFAPVASAGTTSGQLDPVVYRVLGSPNPKASYDALSSHERTAFDRYMLPATRNVSRTVHPINGADAGAPSGINGCWRGWADDSDRALAGNTLYTFHIIWDWCASGTTVTWVGRVDVWAETSTPGWRIDYARWRQSGVVYNEGRVVGEFLFILGAGGWDIQHAYRCLRGGGRSNGTLWADRGCSIY